MALYSLGFLETEFVRDFFVSHLSTWSIATRGKSGRFTATGINSCRSGKWRLPAVGIRHRPHEPYGEPTSLNPNSYILINPVGCQNSGSTSMNDDISTFLSGEKLYGDDFSIDEIKNWFADEAEGYADLGAKERKLYHYAYHELNRQHGFKFIRQRVFNEALGIGSAYGDEFKPIVDSIKKITILDPSDAFSDVHKISGIPCEYVKPGPDGSMPFKNEQFDVITSLGVMHHIPNVTHVMGECFRVLSREGIMLLREPIVSMGDWTKPRQGLTKRERGIPLTLLRKIVMSSGFKIRKESLCHFPLLPRLANKIGVAAYNNYLLTVTDTFLSKLFSWNKVYHRTKLYEKFAPAAVYYVLEK